MAETGLARPTAAIRAAFGNPSSIVGDMVADDKDGFILSLEENTIA
jgi:hypothetical protein